MIENTIIKRKKLGLALGSGGVRGLAHIGVIKTLLKHNIPIDCIAGASIGAWIGAHFALYQDIDKTADFTVGKKKEKLLSFLEPTLSGALIGGEKLESLLDLWLEGASFNDLKIPFKIAATDIISGNKVSFSSGKLAKIIRASMAVPGFFKPVVFEDKILIDAGVSNPVPIDLVKELGADIVLAVNLDFFNGFPGMSPKDFSYMNSASATLNIMRHHLTQYACEKADFVIEPPLRSLSSWSNYFKNNSKDEEIIEIAEIETEKIIFALKEKLLIK